VAKALVYSSLLVLLLAPACGGLEPQDAPGEQDVSSGTWAMDGIAAADDDAIADDVDGLELPVPEQTWVGITAGTAPPPDPDDDPVPVTRPVDHVLGPLIPVSSPPENQVGLMNHTKTVTLDDPVPIQPFVIPAQVR